MDHIYMSVARRIPSFRGLEFVVAPNALMEFNMVYVETECRAEDVAGVYISIWYDTAVVKRQKRTSTSWHRSRFDIEALCDS